MQTAPLMTDQSMGVPPTPFMKQTRSMLTHQLYFLVILFLLLCCTSVYYAVQYMQMQRQTTVCALTEDSSSSSSDPWIPVVRSSSSSSSARRSSSSSSSSSTGARSSSSSTSTARPSSSSSSSSSARFVTSSPVVPPTPSGSDTYQGSNAINTLTPPLFPRYPETSLVGQVRTSTLLSTLSRIYEIAMDHGGNRAIQNPGFNATVAFIEETLRTRTILTNIEKSYFDFTLGITVTNPTFLYRINGGNAQPLTYSTDYTYYVNSAQILSPQQTPTVYVANGGCELSDWNTALGSSGLLNFWVIVESSRACGGDVPIGTAPNFGAAGIMISDTFNIPPQYYSYYLRAPSTNRIAVMLVKSAPATVLINAIKASGLNAVTVSAGASITSNKVPITNICADTPYGDTTSVVLVGGHSDGVAEGPGTNDDGSGTAATLTLAMAMSRLMTQFNYRPVNMVKFCWFGGEEEGLLGSEEIVRVGLQRDSMPTARAGSRAKDWAIMIDLDMLGSINYQNWVYDANQYIPPNTPPRANQGSRIQSNLFFEFFDNNGLPRNSDTFDGRSDYGPFLVAGIPAGGVDAGADKIKTEFERQRYFNMSGWGGTSLNPNDECYHQPCDRIDNIQWGVYTNMTMSAAYVLETLALRTNLRQYLGNPLMDDAADGAASDVKYHYLPYEYRFTVIPAYDGHEMEILY